jgi:hypothetical protein
MDSYVVHLGLKNGMSFDILTMSPHIFRLSNHKHTMWIILSRVFEQKQDNVPEMGLPVFHKQSILNHLYFNFKLIHSFQQRLFDFRTHIQSNSTNIPAK